MELNNCPKCGGEIKLMSGVMREPCQCFARCNKCEAEYDLPAIKFKKAEREWNRLSRRN